MHFPKEKKIDWSSESFQTFFKSDKHIIDEKKYEKNIIQELEGKDGPYVVKIMKKCHSTL